MSLDVYLKKMMLTEVYSGNITHNLGAMADAAGIYDLLWRPEEIGITKAWHIIKPLTRGIARLKKSPKKFKTFNPENGWGDYEGFLRFCQEYLKACIENPTAKVIASR